MKKTFLVAAGLTVFTAIGAGAQDLATSKCPPGSANALGVPDQQRAAQDACQQAYDLYQYMAPQLGISLAGGNATLGTGSTLGGIGHFSVGVRANVIQGSLPQVDKFSTSVNGAQRSSLPTKDQILGLPTADAAIGIFGGLPLGLTNVGGVDVLLSASYVPTVNSSNVKITPSQNVQVGYGLRLGLLQESLVVPGVSVTYIKRDLPTTSIVGTSGNNSLQVNNLKVNTSAWRVVASKSLVMFTLAAGAGKDSYDQSADIAATASGSYNGVPVSGSTSVPGTTQKLDRTNYFVDAAFNLPFFKIVGEVGQVSGGTVQTYNSFVGGRADKSLMYYSLGLRLGL